MVFFTLRSPRVQEYLISTVVNIASDELDTEVKLGGVNLNIFLDIVLEDVQIYDQKGEVMLNSGKIVIDIGSISFGYKRISVRKIIFDKTYLNIKRYEDEENFNYYFIQEKLLSDPPETPPSFDWAIAIKAFEFRESGFLFDDRTELVKIPAVNSSKLIIVDFNLLFSDIVFDNDTVDLSLDKFSFSEDNGFELTNITGLVRYSPVEMSVQDFNFSTPKSEINLNAALNYDSIKDFEDFINKVNLSVEIKESKIDIRDVAFFYHPLKGINDIATIEGVLSGRVASLRARNLVFKFGENTAFNGKVNMSGLPNFYETFLNISVKQFESNIADFKKYYIPIAKKYPQLQVPDNFDNIGNVAFTGSFTGFINDFVSYGKLETDIGDVSTDLVIKALDSDKKISYNGALDAKNLNLGKLFHEEESLGLLTFSSNVKGSGTVINNINVEMDGIINSLGVLGYNYKNIELLGNLNNRSFNGSILIDDENLDLGFNGMVEFQDTIQHFDFNLDIDKANLTKLNIYQRDSLSQSVVSTKINMNFSFIDMEWGEGDAYITNTVYDEIFVDTLQNNHISINTLSVTSENLAEKNKKISLQSDLIDAFIEGEFSFPELGTAFNNYFHNYLPALFKEEIVDEENKDKEVQNFDFFLELGNTAEILDVFFPKLYLAPGTYLEGEFNNKSNVLNLTGSASSIEFFGNELRDWKVNSANQNGDFEFLLSGERLFLTDSIWIDNFDVLGNISADTLNYDFNWDNEKNKNASLGDIQGIVAFKEIDKFDIKLHPSQFIVNDSLWQFSRDNFIRIDSSDIQIKDFVVYKGDEYISIDGSISQKLDRKLDVNFNKFNLDNFDVLYEGKKIDFEGLISGNIALKDFYGKMGVAANVEVKDFGFNHDQLGDMLLSSKWDAEKNGFFVNCEIVYHGNVGSNKPAIITGYFYPEAEHDNFDLDIALLNLRMSMFGRYLEGFASNVRGLATGNLRLEGPLAKPEIIGDVKLLRTRMRVDYLNVPYSLADTLKVRPNSFEFDNIVIYDSLGNQGLATGKIMHNAFKDFSLDISIRPEKMILLNKTNSDGEMFYGSAFASGIANISGPANDIMFNISAKTNRGTKLFLPVDYQGEITENQFITFVKKDTVQTQEEESVYKPTPGLTLNFDLEVTPDAEVQIIFDSQIGDIIRGRGTGDINMEINSQGEFLMFGEFVIQEGEYLFTLENLINKRFKIQEGGNIRWAGDPFDANIDLNALYRVRTSLYDLMMEVDSSDVYRRRVPVDVVLDIGQTLFNPEIKFDINLPASDETTKEAVERLITTEQEMNRQVFSLLVLNRFLPTATMQYNTALGLGVGTTSSELLSNQLSNWLSQISSEVDIGFNYRPGDEISDQEFEMALSTQLFDDRVIIDGNLGVAGEKHASSQRTSNVIGDVNVEVKVTPEGKFRVKAFNRSNTADVLNQNADYTQGIGVFYRKEFDSLKELFKKSRENKPDTNSLELPADSLDLNTPEKKTE
ncbi:MAG: translocation/assembly module TamB domain-containing protein [Bacteroidota bacterium]